MRGGLRAAVRPEASAPASARACFDSTKGEEVRYFKIVAASALSAALAIGMVGCAGDGQGGSSGEGTAVQEAPAEKSACQKAAEAYRSVLENPQDHFALDEQLAPEAVFSYALVTMGEGQAPQMLVRAEGPAESWNGIETTRVFSYDAASDALIAPETDIATGVAGVGGYRGGLARSAYGNGLLHSEFHSATGEGEISRISLEGETLAEAFAAPVSMRSESAVLHVLDAEMRDIAWIDSSDASALDQLEAGEWKDAELVEPADGVAAAQQAGLAVYTGALRVMDGADVVDLWGSPVPNPTAQADARFVILDLGESQELTFHSGAGPEMFTASESALYLDSGIEIGFWEAYDDKQITVAVDPALVFWPSDASIPLGLPRCNGLVAVVG